MNLNHKSYYVPKRIAVVTGCHGFIGSHFTQHLLLSGWMVYGVDLKNSSPATQDFVNYSTFKQIGNDICDLKELPDCDYVFNFAAETHVHNSIEDNEPFIHSNISGVRNLLELIRKKQDNVVKKPTFLHVSCYDEETRAVTKNGLKYYYELTEDDEIISINPDSKKIEFKKIQKIIIQDYSGDMIHFKHKSDDLLITPNHRVFYEKNGKIEKDEAWKICSKTNLYYPRGYKEESKISNFYINGIGEVPIKDLFFVCGAFIGDGFLATQARKKINKSGLSKENLLKRRDSQGRFIASEEIGPEKFTKDSICYRIFFDVPGKDKCRKKLESSLTNLGIKWSAHSGKSGEHIYFSSKEWSIFFEQFGKYAKNKTIPNWMFEYGKDELLELLNGLILSDGYYNKSNTGILTTTSSSLTEKCLILGSLLNYHVKYNKIEVQNIKKSIIKNENRIINPKHNVYYIYFNKQNIGVGNGKFSIKKYNGKVWCLKIPDNKNFLVERNGFVKFSGNTDEVYGDRELLSARETDPLNPSSPYSASKAAADMLVLAWARTYGIEYVIVRPTNNYGTNQHPEKLIPLTIKLALWGKEIRLHNGGTPKRIWCHVSDTVAAIMKIVEKNERGIFNISGNLEQTNLITVSKILMEMDIKPDDYNLNLNYIRPGQDMRYLVDDSKLRKLGWKPERHFDDEIKKIIYYYLESPEERLYKV